MTISTSPNVHTMVAPVGKSKNTAKYIRTDTRIPITQPIASLVPIVRESTIRISGHTPP